MNIKEAVALLERYSNYNGMGIPNLAGCKEAMKVAVESLKEAFPELRESEDEWIRKDIIASVEMNGELTQARKSEIYAYLEKQKDASKAIEAVDRIDKYIDERLANAHDMKDSNPDKKYYRGWDDALGKMAGILQDVYSGEKQKEQKPAEHKAFEEWAEDYWSHNKVNNPYSYNKGDEIQFDHKGFVSFCEAYCYPQNLVLHDTFGYEEGRQTGRNEGVKLVLNNPEKYGLQKEQKPADLSEMMVHKEPYIAPVPTPMVADEHKPAEWSEEDEKKMIFLERLIEYNVPDGQYGWADGRKGGLVTKSEAISMLKSLRPVSKESLQPHWKPSEEQMKALEDNNEKK